MAHPHANVRQHKVEHSRVASLTKGYATGGVVGVTALRKAGIPVQRAVGGKIDGAGVAPRADRAPRRAKGGRVGKTTVNVIVQPSGDQKPPMPMPMMPPPAPPMPPPRPPMPPPQAAAPPPMPGGPPPGMPPGGPIRSGGGRTYASGGAVKSGPGWTESMRTKTPVQHADGKDDATGPYGKNIDRPKPITYAKGGAVHSDVKEDRKLIGKMLKERGIGKRAEGGAVQRPKESDDFEYSRNLKAMPMPMVAPKAKTPSMSADTSANKPAWMPPPVKMPSTERACGGSAMKAGGPISSEKAPMGPKMPGGARGGLGRLAKAHRAAAKR